ncbi:hypothetical protein EJ02DRAFT_434478 [Clathrospora elynae]|uniref:Uncharacterized protein n=1 Tax=Clathrospora elynae TaxID=706981 RepID=A0A6A5SPX2_9PLEO|nr:hypothetical protein EJ02DRAFT_434478 [Clathrospora elynae]
MSLIVSDAARLKLEIRLAQEVSQFEDILSNEQKTKFQNLTALYPQYASNGFLVTTCLAPEGGGSTNELVVARAIAYIEESSYTLKLAMRGRPQATLLEAMENLYRRSQQDTWALTGPVPEGMIWDGTNW